MSQEEVEAGNHTKAGTRNVESYANAPRTNDTNRSLEPDAGRGLREVSNPDLPAGSWIPPLPDLENSALTRERVPRSGKMPPCMEFMPVPAPGG